MERYWMAKKALLNIPVIEGALPPDTFTQVVLYADAQRALDAERADLKEIARKLVLQINEITPVQWDKHDDKDQVIILAALKTARQEAMREAARVADEYGAKEWDKGIQDAMARLSLRLDRLASEGG